MADQQPNRTHRIVTQHQRSLSQPDITPPIVPERPRHYRLYQNQQTPPRINITIPPFNNPPFPQIRQGNLSPVSPTFSQTRRADFEETLSSPHSTTSVATVHSNNANNNNTEYRSIFEPTDEETTYRSLGQESRNNYLEDHERIIVTTSEPEADNQSIPTQNIEETFENENQEEGFPLDNINNYFANLDNQNNLDNNWNTDPLDNNNNDDLIDLDPPEDQDNNQEEIFDPDLLADSSDEGSDHILEEIRNNENNRDNEEMATILVKPPKFAGTHDEDPAEWMEDFIMAANANNWNDDRKKKAIGAYFKKEAHEWYVRWADANNIHDWDALRRAFEGKFCNDNFREQWLEELRGLKQRKTESVEEYYYQVMKMATRATLDAAYTLSYFVKGLLPEIRAVVKTHAPANLNAALTKVKQYEQGKGEAKRRKKKTKHYESSSDESDSSESEDEKLKKKRSLQRKRNTPVMKK